MNERLTQSLRRAAQVNPRGTATIDGSRRHTWREVEQRVMRAAGGLRGLGVADGARVAILSLNGDRYLEAYYAIPWAGGVMVPLNTRLTADDVVYMLDDAEATVLCVDDEFMPLVDTIRARCTSIRHVIHLGDGDAGAAPTVAWDRLAEGAPLDDCCAAGDAVAGIFYTGGSTGRSKGVMLSHRNLVTNAVNAITLIGYQPDSVFLHAAPMCHLTDGMSTVALTMAGGTHVFIPKFEPREVLRQVELHRVTNVTLVPTMIAMMLEVDGIEHMTLDSLRQFMFGSAPMPDATLRRAVAIWPDILFLHGWGMTELAPIGTMLPLAMRRPAIAGDRLRSCGQAMPNLDVRIVDPDGHEVPRGTTGQIVVRGPTVMLGYWRRPAETEAALRDGWLQTGDAAVMDEDGYVTIVDRLKDMIISGGENIYSTEVENAISLMPGVAEVAVIGIPDDKWGERVHAIVVPRDGASLDETAVQAWARERIAGYKVPRSVQLRQDRLPLSGAGKVLKNELRAPFWIDRERRI